MLIAWNNAVSNALKAKFAESLVTIERSLDSLNHWLALSKDLIISRAALPITIG